MFPSILVIKCIVFPSSLLASAACLTLLVLIIWLVFVANITCSDWLIQIQYSPVMPTGQLQACKNKEKQNKKATPNKQKSNIINNIHLVFLGKPQTLALP